MRGTFTKREREKVGGGGKRDFDRRGNEECERKRKRNIHTVCLYLPFIPAIGDMYPKMCTKGAVSIYLFFFIFFILFILVGVRKV